jgi:YQGE family putative transporter
MKSLLQEFSLFKSHPRNMRILLMTNLVYAFVLPVIEVFVAAYIMRNSASVEKVVIYQLTVYTGIPFTFLINGYLLNRVKVSRLYAFGMLLSGVSMVIMTSIHTLDNTGIGIAGLIMGASFGFFWANRDFLVLVTTHDNNRNYYYGLETFFYTLTYVLVPVCIGWFIEGSRNNHWFSGINMAYQLVTAFMILLTCYSSYLISRGNFDKPTQPKFLYLKFHKLWYKMLSLATLKGLVQGFIVTAPAMLVMKLVGQEGALGTIQSAGAVLSAFIMYLIGRNTGPKHRIMTFAIGLLLFAIGTVCNALIFTAGSVFFFMLCLLLAKPLLDIAYFPIQMKVIDYLSVLENRNQYAYFFNHEFGLYIGRFLGCGLFIFLAYQVSDLFALKYALPIVGVIQVVSVFVANHILKQIPIVETLKADSPVLAVVS